MKFSKFIQIGLFLFALSPNISNAGEASNKFDNLVKQMQSLCTSSEGCLVSVLRFIAYPVKVTQTSLTHRLYFAETACQMSRTQEERNQCLKRQNYFNLKSEEEKELKRYHQKYKIAMKAHPLIHRAAQEGNEKALFSYAIYMAKQKNVVKAKELFFKFTKSNNIEISTYAHEEVARMYGHGVGNLLSHTDIILKRDIKKALYHLGQACDNGSNWACKNYNELIDKGYSE